MASNMCTKNLLTTLECLVKFESTPKEIREGLITKWFNVGESIFEELYKLGISIEWNYITLKQEQEIPKVISQVTKNQDWLQTFITLYPSYRIDLDGSYPAADICRTRSGIEVLRQGFININPSFNKVLKDLEELGEIEEFDDRLKVWKEGGYRPDFFTGDKPTSIPQSHWWWF